MARLDQVQRSPAQRVTSKRDKTCVRGEEDEGEWVVYHAGRQVDRPVSRFLEQVGDNARVALVLGKLDEGSARLQTSR